VEGQWAKGRQKPERKRSIANTLIIVLLVASVPLILAYAHYGKHLATFGDHSSMLPWLSASPATSASAAPLRAADEQQPWHGRYERPPGRSQPSHRNADAAAARAVKHAEDTLAHGDQLGKDMRLKRRTGLNPKTGLNALAKSLMHTTDSARAALGGGGGGGSSSSGIGVEDDKASSSHVMWGPTAARTSDLKYRYKAAEREVHELEDKVSFLERKVVEDRVHAHDSQASALVHAETEIARLQKTLTALEREAGNRRRSGSEERKRVVALENENLRLERAVVAHRQHDDEIAKLTARVAELTRDDRQRRKAQASGELSAMHSKLASKLALEEARVKALTENKIKLAAQLDAAHQELASARQSQLQKPAQSFSPPPTPTLSPSIRSSSTTTSTPRTPSPLDESRTSRSATENPENSENSGNAVEKLVKAASEGAGSGGERGRGKGTEMGDKKYKGMSYAAEVQAKENDEEKRIRRQADRMLSRSAEEAGLDSRHRKMLRELEHEKSSRDRTADRAADRDLAARDKATNSQMSST
jgi:hypothetical protein